jgi:hypothetical protein
MPAKKRMSRLIGGAVNAVCPPGVWCMDTAMIVLSVIIIGLMGAFIYYMHFPQKGSGKPTVVIVEKSAPAQAQASVPSMYATPDPRISPLSPEQSYNVPPDLRGFPSLPLSAGLGALPINQPTRGYPDTYQQVGVLTAPGGSDTSASPTRTVLPLYGRKSATNRDRWNYYTRTDGLNPVQVPLQYNRRNCDDDTGCEEIMDGESISVPVLGQSYVANVYRYSTPRYIPF